jgi:hypothetical protein
MSDLLDGFDEWKARIQAAGMGDEMIAWGNMLAGAIRRSYECSCHREYSRWNHEECCGHEDGRDPDCPIHGDGSTS